jgi:hypothetical protein
MSRIPNPAVTFSCPIPGEAYLAAVHFLRDRNLAVAGSVVMEGSRSVGILIENPDKTSATVNIDRQLTKKTAHTE